MLISESVALENHLYPYNLYKLGLFSAIARVSVPSAYLKYK
jgi:hypothetical protein